MFAFILLDCCFLTFLYNHINLKIISLDLAVYLLFTLFCPLTFDLFQFSQQFGCLIFFVIASLVSVKFINL